MLQAARGMAPVAAQARPVSADGERDRRWEQCGLFGFCAYLTGTNNNGTPTALKKEFDLPLAPECPAPLNGDPKALSVVTTTIDNIWVPG